MSTPAEYVSKIGLGENDSSAVDGVPQNTGSWISRLEVFHGHVSKCDGYI